MKFPAAAWMGEAAAKAEAVFARHGLKITLGGEPTYVPENPKGAEWNYAAVGPDKLSLARKLAGVIIDEALPGGTPFFAPGKQYPGEINPRWALRILFSDEPLALESAAGPGNALPDLALLGRRLLRACGLTGKWELFRDPLHPENEVRALLLDHDGHRWQTNPWCLKPKDLVLLSAEGPAGLRLPLRHLPAGISRRALTLERHGSTLSLFFPPLLQEPFLELLEFFRRHLPPAPEKSKVEIRYQGYLPPALDPPWRVLGLASDPGVLEVNLPPCSSWQEYADWIELLDRCTARVGLRAWRTDRGEFPGGTGGGNHLLFGSPADAANCFYERPAWLASIITYWQRHPSLSYLFTGDYVGASSQAPRPDESGINLRELALALADLRDAEDPPGPFFMAENLRHLLVDSAGNPHRAEISLDKFHDPNHPAGLLGLIEFRAIETMPKSAWTNAVAVLWLNLAARLLECPETRPLRPFGSRLHDRYFLPHFLWRDLSAVLADLQKGGFSLSEKIFREIWEWKFPVLLRWPRDTGGLEIRKAHESWPLLAETPDDGGTTSRFVDTSLRRLEFAADQSWAGEWRIIVNGHELPLLPTAGERAIAGLRYRHANLYPSLHPRRPVQLPLRVVIQHRAGKQTGAEFVLVSGASGFRKTRSMAAQKPAGSAPEVVPSFSGAFTHDLRW